MGRWAGGWIGSRRPDITFDLWDAAFSGRRHPELFLQDNEIDPFCELLQLPRAAVLLARREYRLAIVASAFLPSIRRRKMREHLSRLFAVYAVIYEMAPEAGQVVEQMERLETGATLLELLDGYLSFRQTMDRHVKVAGAEVQRRLRAKTG